MDFLFRIAILALGYFYPAYKCFKVIDCGKFKSEQLYMWCQYWIIIAVFTGCERIADTFISWLPFYSGAKLAFVVYLWHPDTKFSSSFHPQTEGQSDIANSVILDLLKSYISDQKTQWKRYLPLVEIVYNNTIHSSTGKAPFEIVEGAMKVPPFLSTEDKILEANEYTRDLDTDFAKIHNVFHVNLWKTFGDVPDDREPDEQPEVEVNEEILVPEQVLAHKVTKKGKARRRFLIEFKNFPAFDAKWMEEEDLADTPQIMKLYLEAFGLA
ncbi:hypothetical protein L7F22_035956 [Adiantum nelumboides]|nr:hypothetical protein [Adiantum nelumboides]